MVIQMSKTINICFLDDEYNWLNNCINLINIDNEEIIKYHSDLAYGKLIDGDFLTARYKFINFSCLLFML